MPFDLASAKPVQSKPVFDINSARPAGPAPEQFSGILSDDTMSQLARPQHVDQSEAEVEADLGKSRSDLEAESALNAQRDAPLPWWASGGVRETVRQAARPLTALARGVLSLPTLVESATGINGPFSQAHQGLSPQELAPQNDAEQWADALTEATGATVGSMGAGAVAQRSAAPVVKEIGSIMQSAPGAQLAGAATSTAASEGAREAGADETTQFLAALAGGVAPGVPAAVAGAKAPKPAPANARATTPLEIARAADFAIDPASAGNAPIGRVLQAAGGSSQTQAGMAKQNVRRATDLAREQIGAKGNLTPDEFARLRGEHSPAYDEVAANVSQFIPDDAYSADIQQALGRRGKRSAAVNALVSEYLDNPPLSGQDALDDVLELRAKANKIEQGPYNPANEGIAEAARHIANAIDNALERNVANGLAPDAVEKYRGARRSLAQIASVEDATRGGIVDPQKLYKQADKGVPLSDNLALIAQVAENYPEVMTVPKAGSDVHGLNLLERLATAVVRRLSSPILRSDAYQGSLAPAGTARLGDMFSPPDGRPDFAPRPPPQLGTEDVQFSPQDAAPTRGTKVDRSLADMVTGDMAVVPEGTIELPPAPDTLTADVPPPVRGDIDFTPSDLAQLGDLLGLTDSPAGSLPGGAPPRAAGMSEQVAGTSLYPELRAVRSGRDTGAPLEELSLADSVSKPLAIDEGLSMANLDNVLRLVDESPASDVPRGTTLADLIGDPVRTRKEQQQAQVRQIDQQQQKEMALAEMLGIPEPEPVAKVRRPRTGGVDQSKLLRDLGVAPEAAEPAVTKSKGSIQLESDNGGMVLKKRGNDWYVDYVNVKPESRGTGQGMALYEKAIQEAGGKLTSGFQVSEQAQRVYSALKRRGYEVITDPTAKKDKSTGELRTSSELKPVYTVRAKKAGQTDGTR